MLGALSTHASGSRLQASLVPPTPTPSLSLSLSLSSSDRMRAAFPAYTDVAIHAWRERSRSRCMPLDATREREMAASGLRPDAALAAVRQRLSECVAPALSASAAHACVRAAELALSVHTLAACVHADLACDREMPARVGVGAGTSTSAGVGCTACASACASELQVRHLELLHHYAGLHAAARRHARRGCGLRAGPRTRPGSVFDADPEADAEAVEFFLAHTLRCMADVTRCAENQCLAREWEWGRGPALYRGALVIGGEEFGDARAHLSSQTLLSWARHLLGARLDEAGCDAALERLRTSPARHVLMHVADADTCTTRIDVHAFSYATRPLIHVADAHTWRACVRVELVA